MMRIYESVPISTQPGLCPKTGGGHDEEFAAEPFGACRDCPYFSFMNCSRTEN